MDELKRGDREREVAAARCRGLQPWARSAATGRGPRRRFVHEALNAALARMLPHEPEVA